MFFTSFFIAHDIYAQSKRQRVEWEKAERIAQRSSMRFASDGGAKVAAHESDSLALVMFYRALGGSVFWSNDTGWLQSPVSDWHGITLDAEGRVTHIDLPGNTLLGEFPSELGELTHLRVLSVADNIISGVIPESVGRLDSLRTFSAWANILQGPLPMSLANLKELRDLLLFLNRIDGEIPSELGQLVRLKRLWLDFNRFTGMIPAELSRLEELTELFLDVNQLQGEIPVELSGLPKLISLYVGYNDLTGPIPTELGNISTLENFLAAGNQHTGQIPAELSKPPLLTKLLLSHNLLSGTIPPEIAGLAFLTTLEVASNQLSGPVPDYLGAIANLRILDLSNNAFAGDIPGSLGVANGLTHMNLAGNQLTGELPGSFNRLNRMQVLDLSGNRLTGSVDVIYAMIRLRELNLRGNSFAGSLLRGFAYMPTLSIVDLGENMLEGALDELFSVPTSIQQLRLDENQLSGVVPEGITQSGLLWKVELQGNQLEGFPDVTGLSMLDSLDVSSNRLTFADLVRNAPIAAKGQFRYAPQDSVKTILTRNAGEIVFTVHGHAPGNQYQWYRDGTAIDGADSDTLRVDAMSDRATYHVEINNSLLPDLTLISRKTDSHGTPTFVEPAAPTPHEFALHQSYPNPFANEAIIAFAVATTSDVRLTLYNVLGQQISTLVDQSLGPGEHEVILDGRKLVPGAYFYRLQAGSQSATRMLSVVR